MNFKFLGTAAAEGWPSLYCICPACVKAASLGGKNIRSRSQAVIDGELLIDFPPDTYMHTINGGLNTAIIKNIIITHTHEDHLYLKDIMLRRKGFADFDKSINLNVFGNDSLIRLVDNYREEDFFKHVEQYCSFTEVFEYITFKAGEYEITPLLADHDPAEKCYIYLIKKGNTTLLYGHDTGYFKESVWEHLKGLKLDFVSLDCTCMLSNDRRNHMGIFCCAEVKQRLIDEKIAHEKTIFVVNHFSHNGEGGCSHEEFCKEAEKLGFLVSYDGMEINI